MSFAGLTYLAIFMAEFVFSLPVPHLSKVAAPIVGEPAMSAPRRRSKAHYEDPETPLPRFPIMGVILLCGIPVLLAIYISSTRFSDYRHHTFDILSGSLLGLFSGVVGWRWYGSWCCAGGDGRVYGLVKRERDRKKRDTEVVEKGATVAEEEQPHPAARRTSGEFGMAV